MSGRAFELQLEPLSEHQEQVDLMRLVRLHETRWPELALLYAIPNGGWRNLKVACQLKQEGVKPGLPDLCLPVARRGCHGLFLELKRTKGGKVADSQKEWHEALRAQGYAVVVCKGAKEAWWQIRWYLGVFDVSEEEPTCGERG